MNNTKSTNASKVRKANKKFVAAICAVITATAMITGVAVFNASASDAIEAPTKPISTIVTVANENAQKTAKADNKADGTKTAFSSEIKLEPKAEINTEAAQKSTDAVKHPGESGYYYAQNESAAQKSTDAVKHPGESGYNYAQNESAAQKSTDAVKHPGESGYYYAQNESAAQKSTDAVKHPGESGYNYAQNESAAQKSTDAVKHPGESGYYYAQNESAAQKSADAVKHPGESGYYYAANQNLFSKDRFVSSDGSRAAMEVTYAGNNIYVCTIRMANSCNNEFVYSFKGVVRGPEIDYTQGAKFDVTYDDNGNIIKSVKIGSDHSGTIERSRAGAFVWIDSDETHVTFIPAQD